LRILVRERLVKGDSDSQVVDFVVARYGEFVLLRPRFSPHNYILWFGPALLLILGIFMARKVFRKQAAKLESAGGTQSLTEAEEVRLNEILRNGETR
jgi:cytochrome c-type biogenesis protein CcmH